MLDFENSTCRYAGDTPACRNERQKPTSILENYSNAQKWKFVDAGNGYYYIRSTSGHNLDVDGARSSDGTNVKLYTAKNGENAQRWKLTETYDTVNNGIYTVTTKLNNAMVLDICGGSSNNEANVQLYQSNGTNAQKFEFTYVSDGWYKIVNVGSGKAVDVERGVSGSKVNVWQYAWNGSAAQLWRLYYTDDGYYRMRNKLGYYLDVYNALAYNGNNVWVYRGYSTDAQKWKLNATSKAPATSSYDAKVNAFLSDSRFRDGAAWSAGKRPELLNYNATGCCAYATDFVRYVFGASSPMAGQAFYNPNEIRAGDVIKVTGSQHCS